MIAIVVSRSDEASTHIGDRLLDRGGWTAREDEERPPGDGGGTYHTRPGFELRTFDDLHLCLDHADAAFASPDLLVFVSRHAGDTGPMLTAHHTGNVGDAEFGGSPGRLARACPNALSAVLSALADHAPEGYDVTMECTHHGPTDLDIPSMFVEVGSAEPQWRDPEAAGAVAAAVLDLEGIPPDAERVVVGFGGGHYAPRFSRIVRETDWTVGHVVADWALEALDLGTADDVLRQAFERSGATRAVIDGDRPDLEAAIEALGYRVVSETWVGETDGVPLDLVSDLEAALRPIDDGLRLGEAIARPYEVVTPDPALVSDATGIDQARAREAVAGQAVAYETEENGNRIAGRVAVPEGGYDDLVGALASLLRERFDTVERIDDELVAIERAFDPRLARDHGVPEGPAFGRLAGGETVEVDGKTVTPEMVHVEREKRYAL